MAIITFTVNISGQIPTAMPSELDRPQQGVDTAGTSDPQRAALAAAYLIGQNGDVGFPPQLPTAHAGRQGNIFDVLAARPGNQFDALAGGYDAGDIGAPNDRPAANSSELLDTDIPCEGTSGPGSTTSKTRIQSMIDSIVDGVLKKLLPMLQLPDKNEPGSGADEVDSNSGADSTAKTDQAGNCGSTDPTAATSFSAGNDSAVRTDSSAGTDSTVATDSTFASDSAAAADPTDSSTSTTETGAGDAFDSSAAADTTAAANPNA